MSAPEVTLVMVSGSLTRLANWSPLSLCDGFASWQTLVFRFSGLQRAAAQHPRLREGHLIERSCYKGPGIEKIIWGNTILRPNETSATNRVYITTPYLKYSVSRNHTRYVFGARVFWTLQAITSKRHLRPLRPSLHSQKVSGPLPGKSTGRT